MEAENKWNWNTKKKKKRKKSLSKARSWAIKLAVSLPPAPLGLFVYGCAFPVISLCTHWKRDAGVWVVLPCINISSAGAFRQNESVKPAAPLQNIASTQSCLLSSREEVEGNITFYCSLRLCTTASWPWKQLETSNQRLYVLYPQSPLLSKWKAFRWIQELPLPCKTMHKGIKAHLRKGVYELH